LLFVLKEGVSWRAIHGPEVAWSTVYAHFRRWTKEGILAELSQMLPWASIQSSRLGSMDSTHVKVHRSGCNPAGGQTAQAIGTSRGGLNTKLHAIVADNGEPLAMSFTGGNNHDNPQAQGLIQAMGTEAEVATLIADRAYDANATRAAIEAAGCKTCIPPKANRLAPATYDPATFARRHVVENFWEVLKRLRRISTRYEKLKQSFEAFVHLAILVQHLRGQFQSAQFRRASSF
jgi:transposase